VREAQEKLAPEVGLEPTTHRLTADCSTIELLWIPNGRAIYKPITRASNSFLQNTPLFEHLNLRLMARSYGWREFRAASPGQKPMRSFLKKLTEVMRAAPKNCRLPKRLMDCPRPGIGEPSTADP
jgi:hypothetical protein